jgi:hypothetical protein
MKKQKRAKLVFGNYACLREWVWRTTESEDPDTDPSLLVKTAESGCDVAHQWKRIKNNLDWEYVSMHPCGGPVRKIESFGRLIKTYDSFPLAKFLGNKDNPFWLINYNGADSMTSRCRKDLFTILVNDFRPKQVNESSTDQFAFVPEPLFHVTADNIHRNWQSYVDSFIERIEEIGKRCNTWLSSHSELAFQSVAREYVQLGRYVGKSAVSIADLAEHVTKARDNLNAQKVLRKLKEK